MVLGDLVIPATTQHDVVCAIELHQLCVALSNVSLFAGNLDRYRWFFDVAAGFSIDSYYKIIAGQYAPYGPDDRYDKTFVKVWKTIVPFKVRFFCWRCIQNVVPTKDFLATRRISFNSNLCLFCERHVEPSLHSLLLCQNVSLVWKEVTTWFEFNYSKAKSFKKGFMYWHKVCKDGNLNKWKEGAVWLAVV